MSFKVRLLLGAAVPFVFCLPSVAQTTISTATTAPVSTSTTGDTTIEAGGSITLDGQTGVSAVTIDSNNTVTNAGSVLVKNADNANGLKILPGFTTGYSTTGSIGVVEDYTRTDTDSDGVLDGPFAQGTGRNGILLAPGGTMTGDITIGAGGSVAVTGNNSAAISLQSILDGNYRQLGSASVTGSNSTTLDFQQNITGNVGIGGSVASVGENSVAVNVGGDVGGEFLIDGSVVATGFSNTSISNYVSPAYPDVTPPALTPDELLNGGPAVEVRGSLARGLLVQGAAVGTVDPTDDVKDVVQDFNENRTQGSISSVGSSPALLIAPDDGAAGRDITLGLVRESVPDTLDDDADGNTTEIIGVFDYNYGLMNRGSITSTGFNDGFTANAIRIAGSADGTHTLTIDGGIFNGGSISSSAYNAASTAISIGSGVTTPQFVNIGSISSQVFSRNAVNSTAIQIDAGANLQSVTNSGSIVAAVNGYTGDAIAFRDLSGTVTSFTNTSRIATGFNDDDTTDTITSGTGRAIALDFSHNTTGVTLTQQDTIDNARIFGAVDFGSGSDHFNLLSGLVQGDIDFGSGSDTLNIDSASLTGAATFGGAGANISLANSATMTGGLSLGSAASMLTLASGSVYDGAITRAASGGSLAISVNNSTLNNRAAGTLNVDTLTVSNGSDVGFVINNARATSNTPIFNVLGTATIAGDTKFTPIFEDFTNQNATLRVLNAGTLNIAGNASDMLNSERPFIYNTSLTQNGNALDLDISVKTPTELGLTTRQASSYDGVLSLLAADNTVGAAFTSIRDANVFTRAWSDILPGPNASIAQVLATDATAAFGAAARRLDLVTDRPDGPGSAWIQEFGVYHNASANGDDLNVTGGGFGVAGGLDLIHAGNYVLGASVGLDSLKLDENGRTSAPISVSQTTVGGYGGWKTGQFAINGSANAGFLHFTSNRDIIVGSLIDTTHAEWDAHTFSGAARATYSVPLGIVQAKPYVSVDYLGLWQDGYQETSSATTATGLALTAGKAESHLITAGYGLSLTSNFGSDDTLRFHPSVSVGYRNVVDWTDKAAQLGYAGGGSTFNLSGGHKPEDALTAGLGIDIDSQYLNIKVGYDAEIANDYTTHYGSITLRLAFW